MTTQWPDNFRAVAEDSAEALGKRLAVDVGACLERAIAERGVASLMVSGGSTPYPFFAALSKLQIDWSRVSVGLVDERYLAPDHADSNERLVRERLLVGPASAANFIGMYKPGGYEAAVTASEHAVAEILSAHGGKFDVVVLGMGGDAHTASLFPAHDGNREQLKQALQLESADISPDLPLCCHMIPAEAPYDRISLTLMPIIDSRNVFLHITGESKQQVLLDAVKTAEPMATPIAAVFSHPARTTEPVVYWAA